MSSNPVFLYNCLAVLEKERKATLFVNNPEGELYLKSYHPSSGWTQLQPLSGGVSIYTAAYGINKNLYLLEIDNMNCFKLKLKAGNRWEENVFFQEEKDKKISHLQLLSDYRGNLHLIYLLSSAGGEQWWLIHHCLKEQKWEDARVIDFGGEGSTNHSHAIIDKNNILHIVYSIRERKRIPLYHRTFLLEDSTWSRAVFLSVDQNNFNPFIFEGPDLNLHLVWCASFENSYIIRHSKKVRRGWPSGDKWTPATEISSPSAGKVFPYINFCEDILKIRWVSEKSVFQRASYDEGINWENIQKIDYNNDVHVFGVISSFDRSELPRLQWVTTWDDPVLPVEISIEKLIKTNETEITPHLKELQRYSANLFPESPPKKTIPQKRHVRSPRYQISSKKTNTEYEKEEHNRETEKNFNMTLQTIKKKYQLSRQVWEEENLKLVKENQKLKEEKTNLEQKLDKKNRELKKLKDQAKHNGKNNKNNLK